MKVHEINSLEAVKLGYVPKIDLKDGGFNTREISKKLTEMGYLSVRGKTLLSKHVWSMIKKNRVRLERSKEFHKEIRNYRWVYRD